ncbi:MAG TPA: NAD-dependent deacylase [Phycisphaerales bacterium]|nr:NAD-dependent deacylase [Phycisphaerales bacterium]
MNPSTDKLHAAARAVASSRSVVVLTGAGVSAESGIPTFRGGMEALWKSFDPQTLATPEAFARDPRTVTEWYDWRRQKCREAIPNKAHLALAELEGRLASRAGAFTLLTQNVDRLHHRAGSRNVVELHGNIMQWRCDRTGKPADVPEGPFAQVPVPSPHHPGAHLRPCVVWFGEALPEAALRAAFEATHACDLFMSIGTSAVVYPAAGFVELASSRGAKTIEINRDSTPISRRVDWSLRGPAGEILPMLLDQDAA